MNDTQIAERVGPHAGVAHLDQAGAPGEPIRYRPYPSGQPIFD